MGLNGSSAAAAHLQLTRAWCSEASIAAGVPQPLQLLPVSAAAGAAAVPRACPPIAVILPPKSCLLS